MTFTIVQRASCLVARERLTRTLYSDSSIPCTTSDTLKIPSCADASNDIVPPEPGSVRPPGPSFDFFPIASLFTTQRVDDPCALWHVLTAAALLAFHRETLIGELWRYLSTQCHCQKTQLAMARKLRETCLKSSVLVGFPRAINGLKSLKSSIDSTTPHLTPILAADTSLRAPLSGREKYERGKAFFAHIYNQHTDRVLAALGATSGGDLSHFAISSIYGELMAETSILGDAETGLLEFVCCLADGVAPQAKGHFFGSRNLGASGDLIRATIVLVGDLARQLGVECLWKNEDFRFLEKAALW